MPARIDHVYATWCQLCLRTIPAPDLKALRITQHPRRVHLRCMTELERRAALQKLSGVRCIFCPTRSGSMSMAELVDHFGREHGQVLVNW